MDAKTQYVAAYPQIVNGVQQPTMMKQKLPPSKMWVVSRLLFSISSAIMAVLTIGLGAGIANYTYHGYTIEDGNLILGFLMIGPQAIVALIWDVAEWITICSRRGHRGIHPGAHVGMSLVIWLGLACGVGLFAGIIMPVHLDRIEVDDDGDYVTLSDLLSLDNGLAGVGGTLCVIHFIWFILACVETSRINTAAVEAAPMVIMVQQPAHVQNGGASLPPPTQGYYYVPANTVGQNPQQQLQSQYQFAGLTPSQQQLSPPALVHSNYVYQTPISEAPAHTGSIYEVSGARSPTVHEVAARSHSTTNHYVSLKDDNLGPHGIGLGAGGSG